MAASQAAARRRSQARRLESGKMRIAIGQLWQETNTFNRNPTRRQDFENWGVGRGQELLDRYGTTGEIGGFLAGLKADAESTPIELVGLRRFACWPWGPIEASAWKWIQQEFVDSLRAAGRVDAVLLALHGALAAQNEPDVTGALLNLVRCEAGPEVWLAGSLDLHANVTPRMMRSADLLTGYHTCPHLDQHETGVRTARGLLQMMRAGARPRKIWRKIPMITPAETHNTFHGPPAPLYRQLEAWERQPHVLSAGLYMVMPWFDAPHLGWTVTLHCLPEAAPAVPEAPPVRANGSRNGIARNGQTKPVCRNLEAVDSLSAACWQLRETMSAVVRHSAADAVARAVETLQQQPGRSASASGADEAACRPVVIGDGADATNSGAPGDSTVLLRELLRCDVPGGALTFVVDPDAVARAYEAGVGEKFQAFVGGAFSPEYYEPIRLQGVVERLFPMRFTLNGHGGRDMPIDMGRAAVIRARSVSLVLTERNGPGSSPQLYEAAGLDPRRAGIVIAKSPAGFRADYEPYAAEILLADCPGCAMPNWHQLRFQQVDRPLWPLEAIAEPQEAPWAAASSGAE